MHRFAFVFDQGPFAHPHHELTCGTCGAIMERAVEERPISPGQTGDPEVLPLVRQRIADWDAMEQRRKEGTLRPDDREEMIRTAMLSFARLYDERPVERLHPLTRLTLTLIVIAVVACGAWLWWGTNNIWWLAGGVGCGALLSFIFMVWIRSCCPRTRVRTWVAAALAPLDPTEAEVTAIKREMLTSRLKSGECIKPSRMIKEVKRLRTKNGASAPSYAHA